VGLPSIRARSHLAWTLAELGEFGAARRIATEGMQLADASQHPYSLAHACLGLGGTRLRQGEFEAAIPILARGLQVSEQVPLLRPPIAADLGVAYARSGRIGDGLAHLDAAVAGATRMGRMSRLPLMIAKCGEIHLLAGEPDAARTLATSALEQAVEQKERGNEVYARHLLAVIHAGHADGAAEAAAQFTAALSLAQSLGMRPLAAHCHAGLGRLRAGAGDRDAAHHHLSTALAAYREMAMRFWVGPIESAIDGPEFAAYGGA
jgi:tetratricopeptide (TPR) repeat protein